MGADTRKGAPVSIREVPFLSLFLVVLILNFPQAYTVGPLVYHEFPRTLAPASTDRFSVFFWYIRSCLNLASCTVPVFIAVPTSYMGKLFQPILHESEHEGEGCNVRK